MHRFTVNDIAKSAGCSAHLVRKLADDGLVESKRDYNGWRIFVDPEQAVEVIQKLVFGDQEFYLKRAGEKSS